MQSSEPAVWTYDRQLFEGLLQTEDHAEGAAVFSEDCEPEFEGK